MRKKRFRPLLRALSALSINISAAWFAAAFIGPNINFPKSIPEFISLTISVFFGIVCLLVTIELERILEK